MPQFQKEFLYGKCVELFILFLLHCHLFSLAQVRLLLRRNPKKSCRQSRFKFLLQKTGLFFLLSTKEPARLTDLQLRVEHCHATIPFVLDGQVLAENLTTCGKDAAWLERTAQANSLLLEEILILAGNDTEDYFLLKKEPRQTAGLRQGGAA